MASYILSFLLGRKHVLLLFFLSQVFIVYKLLLNRKHRDKFLELKKGQDPKFMVFACSDSRVSPSHIFNFKPGEAFMVRNIANMVPPSNLKECVGVGAALEYAVLHLKIKSIVVMGHSRCGGIQALMGTHEHQNTSRSFVEEWIKIEEKAKGRVAEQYGDKPLLEQRSACEMEAIKISLQNLLTYPFVKEAAEEGKISIYGAFYDFVANKMHAWEFQA